MSKSKKDPQVGKIFDPRLTFALSSNNRVVSMSGTELAVSLSEENLKLRTLLVEVKSKIRTVASNFSSIGASSSRLENAKHEMWLQKLIDESFILLSSYDTI